MVDEDLGLLADDVVVAARRVPLRGRLHELTKALVAPKFTILLHVLDRGGVRVEDARVDLRKPRRVAAALPLWKGQLLGAARTTRHLIPRSICEAVVSNVAYERAKALAGEEAANRPD